MATGLPVLERERTEERDLKAYGRLGGRDEAQEMTEEQKALRFNARISDNYQKLINPEYNRAEDFAAPVFEQAAQQEVFAPSRPVFDSAPVFEAPAQAPVFQARAAVASPEYAPVQAAPVYEPQAPAEEFGAPAYTDGLGYEQPADFAEESADLMPTATTIQYRSDLFENEKQTVSEEKKRYSLTAKGKLLMAVYALVVVVILELIIVNTSVLRTLDQDVAAQEARLSEVMAEQSDVQSYIDEITSDDYIISWAEDNGFVRG